MPRWSPLTLVLATIAGWAFLVALTAATGLGGRYRLHDADPSLAPPLPEVALTAATDRLGPVSNYAEASARPLFSPDRRPAAVVIADGEAAETPFNFVLTSILLTDGLRMALIRDSDSGKTLRVREGEPVEGHPAWRLVELAPRQAIFDGPSGRSTAELRVFDGSGGEAPTAVTPPQQPAAAQAGAAPPATTPAAPAPGTPEALNAARAARAGNGELTPEQQAEAIRQRIEARRAQLREQAARRQQRQDE